MVVELGNKPAILSPWVALAGADIAILRFRLRSLFQAWLEVASADFVSLAMTSEESAPRNDIMRLFLP